MSKYVVQASWNDVPHLSEEAKKDLVNSYPPHERDARIKGIPQLGSGAIYPVPESEITVTAFEWPYYWKQVFGLDVGWNRTAAVWGAFDSEHDMLYLTSEHYRAQAEPAIHAQAIRARGEWIPGVIDPASRGRSQSDGDSLLAIYRNQFDLQLNVANNAVEAGLYEVWSRLSTGRLKVFSHLANWLAEYRLYRRDEKGRVVKEHDHLMDATRYLVMSGLEVAAFRPREIRKGQREMTTHYDPVNSYETERGLGKH